MSGTDLTGWRAALAPALAPLEEPRLHMLQPRRDAAGERALVQGGLEAARAQGNCLWTAHFAVRVLQQQLEEPSAAPTITPADAAALLAEADAAAAAARAALPPAFTTLWVRNLPGEEEGQGIAALRGLIGAHAARGDATWRGEELRQLAAAAEARRAGPAQPATPVAART